MAATLSFARSLLGEECHQAVVDLNDGEIKALEQIRAYLIKQIHITEQFVHAMNKLNSSSVISKVDLDDDSPFVQTWQVFFSENINVLAVLNQFTSMFSSSIAPRLDKLLSHVKEVQKQYKVQRFRIDSELKTVCDEERRLKGTYVQHAEDAENARVKLEACKSTAKGTDKNKEEKFLKTSLKLYQNHNDYVLAITSATIHHRHYRDGIIPNLMNSLQTVKHDLMKEWKEIFRDLMGHIKTFGNQNVKLSEAVFTSLDSFADDDPYQKFLQNKSQNPPAEPSYAFDETLLNITPTSLEANEIGLNDLTYEQLKTKNTLLEQSVAETKTTLSGKSSEYQIAKDMLAELRETSPGALTNYGSIFLQQMSVADLSRELKEASCLHEKVVAQHEIISDPLEKVDKGSLPQFSNEALSRSNDSFGSAETRKSGRTMKRLKGLKVIPFKKPPVLPKKSSNGDSSLDQGYWTPTQSDGFSLKRPLPSPPQPDLGDDEDLDDYDEPVETPLEEELWYHGTISRNEAEDLLQTDGDYLVRESSRKPGQFVLSSRWDTARHFIIQQDETGKFRLEGEAFPTVTHLIDYHRKRQWPVTQKSNALLKNPILRQKSQGRNLTHDNVIVTSKLGRGHFGDVMKGKLQDTNEEVAVKTCRDNVLPAMKEKFLQEAQILAQYDHPNIVKLIGVAIDKEPVYIVMELMAGGDYLNFLRKNGCEILRAELLQFAIDAASGMTYLASMGCIHRDLAARNCLLDKVKILKISDFGMSRETDFYECSNMKEIPVKWTAPEALNYSQYTSLSDVWSFGVLLWETYSLGNTPYPGMNNKETREQVDRGYRMPPPSLTPDMVYELMRDCWRYEPGDRPEFYKILQRLKKIKALAG